jgi:phenylacetate-CoA ligase
MSILTRTGSRMSEPVPLTPDERLSRADLSAWQADRLRALVQRIHGRNRFYTRKLDAAGIRPTALRSPADLTRLPMTTKRELVADQDATPPWGTALTQPIGDYTRYCQTSSTTGRPLRWVDTNDSWQWVVDCWKAVYRGARVGPEDRIVFPFSFGPFLGFWSAFDAACQIGAHAVPAGGMSSQMRLAIIDALQATVICCTPTYALRLAEVAAAQGGMVERGGHPLAESSVRVIVVAGEPGGSIPATRARIEEAWGSRVIDHHGLTEVGPVSFECWEQPGGLHVNEPEFICEVVDPESGDPVPDGEPGELVLTNLGRTASPILRYRTGDIVSRSLQPCVCGRTWARLEGGILTRADDMVAVRGVNVYPAAIEAVVRSFPEIVEFRSTIGHAGAMRSLSVEVEVDGSASPPAIAMRVAHELREALGLTVPVRPVDQGSLPRYEMKARRFVVED